MITKVISGGQAGVDRLALDVAIELGIEHGGFCPRGRRAQDGTIPERYQLTEMEVESYPARTRANVELADYTVVFMLGKQQGMGSKLTIAECLKRDKPYTYLHLVECEDTEVERLFVLDFTESLKSDLAEKKARVLNVAGTRGSRCTRGFLRIVRQVLEEILTGGRRPT